MTLSDISLAQYVSGKLRAAVVAGDLTDYNSSNRTASYGNWIYPDAPMLVKLLGNSNNFPRISIESLSHSTQEEMGMEAPEHLESDTLKINIWSVRDLICPVKSTVDETIVYASGTTTYELLNQPVSEITEVTDGVPTTFVKGIDYQLIDDSGDGFFDSIKWLGASTPVDTTDFYVDYKRSASAGEIVRILAQNVNAYLRTWRDWTENIIWSYKLISSVPVPYDEMYGVFRYEMVVKFEGINIGETV
jgi:hypothetical protein